MVLQLRIDERLAHGQVCTTWINTLGASHIIIGNDTVAEDEFQKSIMKIGLPNTVKSIFTSLERTCSLINNPKSQILKIFVIVQTPKDALYILQNTKNIKEVNLANYGQLLTSDKEIKLNLSNMVKLDEDDLKNMKEIEKLVDEIYFQDIVGRPKRILKFN